MNNIDIEGRKQFYAKYNDQEKKSRYNLGLGLIRDYEDIDTLKRMEEFCLLFQGHDQPFIYCKTNISYIEALANLLDKINNDAISDFFIKAYSDSVIKYDENLEISESKAKIFYSGDKTKYQICLPNINKDSNLSSAILTHELTHYLLTMKKRKVDAFEYSEALSMYFEYLMYLETSKNGYPYFIKNRLTLLTDTCDDLSDDLEYALYPEKLGIDTQYYEGALSASNAYLESLEYALNLIAISKKDKNIVNNSIGRILKGESTCLKEANSLGIDTSCHKQLKKVIKKI